jgi:hypothetical protein
MPKVFFVKGSEQISGYFKLYEKTIPSPYNADADHVTNALESLCGIGRVDTQRFQNTNGVDFMVMFKSELGNPPSSIIHDYQLFGSTI